MRTKIIAVLVVIGAALLLSALLISQADAKVSKFDQRVTAHIKGGTVKTQTMAQWELFRYKTTVLPKKYPFKYAPWKSFLAIDKYVEVSAVSDRNTLVIDPELYRSIQPEAEANRVKAKRILKRYKVRGKKKAAVKKIRRYVRTGKYITGVKSAGDFFDQHGGDCAAHASAVYVLCKVQGIPVRYCIGGAWGSCHAWNRVKYGGKWYWVDETLDQPPARKLWDGYKKPMEMW